MRHLTDNTRDLISRLLCRWLLKSCLRSTVHRETAEPPIHNCAGCTDGLAICRVLGGTVLNHHRLVLVVFAACHAGEDEFARATELHCLDLVICRLVALPVRGDDLTELGCACGIFGRRQGDCGLLATDELRLDDCGLRGPTKHESDKRSAEHYGLRQGYSRTDFV